MNNNMDFDLAELKTICKKIRAPGIAEAVEALMSDPAAFDTTYGLGYERIEERNNPARRKSPDSQA
jgi:hypothetical protein